MTDFSFAPSVPDAVPAGTVVRAGGTDLQQRLRMTGATPPLLDLTRIPGFTDVSRTDGVVTIGAGATVARVARELADSHPALAVTAGGLATPQVRAVATIGGNIVQHTRCPYYRHRDLTCLKSGGTTCPARNGEHLYGVAFDTSECVHPHPSSVAMALLAHDATVELSDGSTRTVAEVLGDGSDATRDHDLPDATIITRIVVPAPWEGELGSYHRIISRFEAEWPLVEVAVRARFDDDGTVGDVALALGGVAPRPFAVVSVTGLLAGRSLTDDAIDEASEACTEGANPLPATGYKVPMIHGAVRHVLEDLRSRGPGGWH